MANVSDYTQEQWAQYSVKLDEFASGNTVGDIKNQRYGTCCYCEHSQPELRLPAYDMFDVLKELTRIARLLSAQYYEGLRGRTAFRIKAAAELAEFIRKEILK